MAVEIVALLRNCGDRWPQQAGTAASSPSRKNTVHNKPWFNPQGDQHLIFLFGIEASVIRPEVDQNLIQIQHLGLQFHPIYV